jgi:hypothetical protein
MSALKLSSLVLLVALGLAPAPTVAQSRERGPIVLELPASTRALALGNSFALGFGDADAVFYHPGLLDRAQGMAASLQRFGASGTLTTFSAGRSWWGGGILLGIQQLGYEAPGQNPLTATHILDFPADEASLRNDGAVGVSELVISAGYGRRFMGARLGAVGKFVEQRVGYLKAGTMAVDVGLAVSPGPITVGITAQNLGPEIGIGGGEIPLPTRFTAGAASRPAPVGPLDLSATTAVSYRLDGDVIPSVGLEVGYWPVVGRTFVGRVGYRYLSDEFSATPVTFGGAFFGDDLILEYTFQGYESGDPSHRFGIGWR